MEYDGSKYYFRKNLQGDVVSVLNESGTSVASYTYDAWGAVLTSSGTMASVNPFRYRGYYYDTETKLYYLQSRYYDPSTGRFLNPDTYSYSEPETLHGLNLYVYCNNNPVMGYDPEGTWNWATFGDICVDVLGALVGVAAGIATGIKCGSLVVGVLAPILGPFGVVAGVVTGVLVGLSMTAIVMGALNNAINATYYNSLPNDVISSLTPTAYSGEGGSKSIYLNRWERLCYAKAMTEESKYNLNAWRYYSEYSFHMYGWFVTCGSDDPNVGNYASSFQSADVFPNQWDGRPKVDLMTILFGILGI